ncbi:MAG: translocation/assembly module TamB domain-containing protein, partial [Bryobacterales bacterium]|nr:translocation/assembly module TamB domain-containing protein [Bryobacterales bacterium]
IKVAAPRFGLTAGARLTTQSPYPTAFDLKADATDLSRFGVSDLTGAATFSVKGYGNLAEFAEATATLEAHHVLVKALGVEVRNQGPLEIRYGDRSLEVVSARLDTAHSHLSLQGRLPLEETDTANPLLVRGSFDIAEIVTWLPAASGVSGKGTVLLDAAVRGSLRKLDPSGKLLLENGVLAQSQFRAPLSDAFMAVRYEDGAVYVDRLAANLGAGSLEAEATVPLGSLGAALPVKLPADAGPATFSLNLKNLGLKSFRAVPESMDGTVSLRVEGHTPKPADPQALRAKATFQQLLFKMADFELGQSGVSALSVEQGAVRVDQLHLTGPATDIALTGSAALAGDQPIDVRATGRLDASVLTLLTEGFKVRGASVFELALGGKTSAPQVSGFFEMKDGQASLRTPQVGAESLDIRLEFNPESLQIRQLTGTLNGGSLKGSGSVGYRGAQAGIWNVDIAADGAYLEFPHGLRSRLQANLKLRSQDEFVVVGGAVQILESSYRKPLEMGGETFSYFRSGGGTLLLEERNPFLNRVRFDLALNTAGPVLVDNNLAKLTLNADLNLVGGYYRPGLTGRLSLDEGGKLFFSERTYLIDRGVVSFNSQTRIEPNLDILARTEVRPYEITLQLSGPPEEFSATFTSDPPLSEPNIVSVLLTGRPLEDLEGAGLAAAREQVGSLLAGRVAGIVSRGAQQTLGLSQVRIDPSFINAEANPGARLTLGQDVTNRLQLIYSMNLVNGGDQIYIVRHDITRRFQAEGTRQSDNTYRFDFRHDMQFGGEPDSRAPRDERREQEKIASVDYRGNPVFPAAALADRLDLNAGDTYDFFKLQRGIDRLVRFYDRRGHPEARVRADRRIEGSAVAVTVDIDAGPQVDFIFEGRELPGSVRKQVRTLWQEGLFDTERAQDAVREIRAHLVRRNYLQARVGYEIRNPTASAKRVIFVIDAGTRFRDVTLVLDGATGLPPEQLKEALRAEGLIDEIYLEPSRVLNFLARYYRQEGYLDVRIGDVRLQLDGEAGTGQAIVPVEEGPRFKIAGIRFRGNQAFTENELRAALPLTREAPFRPAVLEDALNRLEELYWVRGYNDVVVQYTATRGEDPGGVQAEFRIVENKQEIVQAVKIEGNRATSRNLVQNQLALRPGDVLDLEKTNHSRRSLYDTGAYSLVQIQSQPEETVSPALAAHQKPVTLQVKLREVRPFEFRYGAFYDTERGPGAIADFSNRNSLGSARYVGVRTRWDADIRELRGYFSQPFLKRFPVQSNIIGYRRREIEETFITDRTGVSLQQEARFGNRFIASYGYRLERTHTFDKDPDSPFQLLPYNIAPLTATVTRETRDDALDATRGSFLSQAFEFAPSSLWSDIRFVRYFGQYFKYIPLAKPVETPFGNGAKRSRWIYAGVVRVGLAKGLGGQDLIFSERFRAGGGTTMRGFEQNTLGPVDFLGDPAGGNALLLLNNEARFPLFSLLEGVGFLDLGNIYPKVSDFSLAAIRKVGGFGVRIRTPYFLLRADYGIKLDRKTGEAAGKFFFSIGQAF